MLHAAPDLGFYLFRSFRADSCPQCVCISRCVSQDDTGTITAYMSDSLAKKFPLLLVSGSTVYLQDVRFHYASYIPALSQFVMYLR